MDVSSNIKKLEKNRISRSVDNNGKFPLNFTKNKEKKEIFINSYKDYSELKQFYKNSYIKNISIDFEFSNTKNIYNFKRTFPIEEYPMFEQRNIFYYDSNFQLFKNKTVSKFGKRKNNSKYKSTKQNKIYPQHNIITTVRRIKTTDDIEKDDYPKNNNKKEEKAGEKDIYELQVINQVLFNGQGEEEKNTNNYKTLSISNDENDNEEEWGEVEQNIFEKEKNKKNNLINLINFEIEKENGDKKYISVEITKNEKQIIKQFAKIITKDEDKYYLQSDFTPRGDLNSTLDKNNTKETLTRNSYDKTTNTNTSSRNRVSLNSFKNYEPIILKNEKASGTLLKEFDQKKRLFPSVDTKNKNSEKILNMKHLILKENPNQITPIIKEIFNKNNKLNKENKLDNISKRKIKGILKDSKININKPIDTKEKYFYKSFNISLVKTDDKKDILKEVKSKKMKIYDYASEKVTNERKNKPGENNINQNIRNNYRYDIKFHTDNDKSNIRNEYNPFNINKYKNTSILNKSKDKIKETKNIIENKSQSFVNKSITKNNIERKNIINNIEIIPKKKIIERNNSTEDRVKYRSPNKSILNKGETKEEANNIKIIYHTRRDFEQNEKKHIEPKIIYEKNNEQKYKYRKIFGQNDDIEKNVNDGERGRLKERAERERIERERKERIEREKKERERNERIEKERKERERKEKEKKSREKREQEEKERKLREKKEQEERERERERERKLREKQEQERKLREKQEQERKLREKREKEEKERKIREKKEQEEKERKIREKKEQEERERKLREKEKERIEKQLKEKQLQKEKERKEKEKKAKEEREKQRLEEKRRNENKQLAQKINEKFNIKKGKLFEIIDKEMDKNIIGSGNNQNERGKKKLGILLYCYLIFKFINFLEKNFDE